MAQPTAAPPPAPPPAPGRDAAPATGVVLAALAVLSLCLVRSFDAPWVIAAGDRILATGGLPSRDPFSYTQAVPWMHHEWLAEIAWALVHRLGGWVAVGAATAALAMVPAWLVLRRGPASALAAPLPAGLGPVLAAVLGLGLREVAEPVAQLFSTVLFAATVRLLVDAERRAPGAGPPPSTAAAVLAIQLLWTQLHGGNPTGVALLGAFALAARSRGAAGQRGLLLLAAAAATLAGPYGARVHEHFFAHRGAFAAVREFQPLSSALAAGSGAHWGVVALVAAATAALRVRGRRGERVRLEALALALFSLVTIVHVRLATETALVAAAALAPLAARARTRAATSLAIAAALLACGVAVSGRRLGTGPDPARFPVEAAAYLAATRPPGPLFNSYNFGGYLLWAGLGPVFIDGRAFTVYSDEQIRDLSALYDDPGRFAALERRWGFRLAVLQRRGRGAGLLAWLAASGRWRLVHEDPVAVVLVRGGDEPPPAGATP